ncbi:MAG: hypothetical protein GY804_12630 [Alphaproteobacteria bacterium]|nr:hypothetical protein [Alphaproteobacteria bacterium]
MDRRNFLQGGGAIAVLLTAGAAVAADKKEVPKKAADKKEPKKEKPVTLDKATPEELREAYLKVATPEMLREDFNKVATSAMLKDDYVEKVHEEQTGGRVTTYKKTPTGNVFKDATLDNTFTIETDIPNNTITLSVHGKEGDPVTNVVVSGFKFTSGVSATQSIGAEMKHRKSGKGYGAAKVEKGPKVPLGPLTIEENDKVVSDDKTIKDILKPLSKATNALEKVDGDDVLAASGIIGKKNGLNNIRDNKGTGDLREQVVAMHAAQLRAQKVK